MALREAQLCFNTACLPGDDIFALLAAGQAMGFRAVELLAFDGYRHRMGRLAGFYWDRLSASERQRLRRHLEPFDRVALHAPFIDLHPLAPNPAIREASVAQIEWAIAAAAALGAEVVTTHAIGVNLVPYDEIQPQLIDLYRWLGDLAEAAGARLTIETGWPPPEQFGALLRAIDHPAVGATVDVGHLISALPPDARSSPDGPRIYNDMLSAHIEAVAPFLFHLHIHDVRFPEWRDHARLGTGIIDFRRLITQLEALDYQGLISFELEESSSDEALRESRDYLLHVLAE